MVTLYMMTRSKKIRTGDLEFDYRDSGIGNKEVVILLHGFPETSAMWRHLMDHLASEGFYCVAPDMRGYSAGACPKGAKNYTIDLLSTDILNIADGLGIGRFHLIGHDWGAVIGWNIVFANPERIISWTALSVPHSASFAKAFRTDPIQKKKSRYIAFFLLPYLPEIMIRRHDFKALRQLWKNADPKDIDHYLSVFRRASSLVGALNYYRANLRKGKNTRIGAIKTPTLFIWGKYDMAVGEVAAKGTEKYMTGDYNFLELEGGHWLIRKNYDEVAPAIRKHLSEYKVT